MPQDNETSYKAVFENMQLGLASCKLIYINNKPADFTYLVTNKAFESLTGLKDLAGKKVSEAIPGIQKTNPELFETYGRVVKSGIPESFETRVEALNGWYSVYVYRLGSDTFATIIDNITESKKSEEAMRQIQLVVDNSYDAIIGESFDGTVTSWNGGATRMFGYTASEMIGKSILIMLPSEMKDELPSQLSKIQKGEIIADYDTIRIRKDGTRINVAVSMSPVKTKDDTLIGASVVERDITTRKKSEESIRQIQLVVDNSYDAIIGQTLDGIITSWNGGAERMMGYNPSEMIGKSSSVLIPKDLKDEMINLLSKIKAGEWMADHDTKRTRKDGTIVDISLTISPIKDKAGKITGAAVVYHDISERKKEEAHIRELNEVRNKFIEIISHQLRTPLTAINWNIETILNGDFGKLDDTQYKFLKATHDSSIKLTARIQELLTAMDIQEGRITFLKEDVAVDNLAASIVDETAPRFKIKNISFQYASPENELPNVVSDSEKIRISIFNLIDNANIYTSEGTVIVKLAVVNNVIHFEVKDTGVGIPQPEQHRVFTRFFRASNASTMQPDSFGLGLFMAKSFIEQLGGKIGFESKEGVGSTFWFELPIKR